MLPGAPQRCEEKPALGSAQRTWKHLLFAGWKEQKWATNFGWMRAALSFFFFKCLFLSAENTETKKNIEFTIYFLLRSYLYKRHTQIFPKRRFLFDKMVPHGALISERQVIMLFYSILFMTMGRKIKQIGIACCLQNCSIIITPHSRCESKARVNRFSKENWVIVLTAGRDANVNISLS